MPSSGEKEIFYNILHREIDNLLAKTPLFWTFRDSIFQLLVNYIDPYVNVLMDKEKLDIDMTADFAKEEINKKIERFKQEYKDKINENKTDF